MTDRGASCPLSPRGKCALASAILPVLAVVVLALLSGGCKSLPTPAKYEKMFNCAGGFGAGGRAWMVFTTHDDEAVCIWYFEGTRPENFTMSWGTEKGESWVSLDGSRLAFTKGQCLLITNGKSGEPLQISVPWIKRGDPLFPDLKDRDADLQRMEKLFAPLTPKE